MIVGLATVSSVGIGVRYSFVAGISLCVTVIARAWLVCSRIMLLGMICVKGCVILCESTPGLMKVTVEYSITIAVHSITTVLNPVFTVYYPILPVYYPILPLSHLIVTA